MSDPTEEMLLAGSDALWAALGTCKPGPLFDHAAVAGTVYRTMRALEPKGAAKTQVVLRLDTSDLERRLAAFEEIVGEFKAAVEAATAEE